MTRSVAIAYRNGDLEACEQDDVWTVRLANLEARARYLDLALAELLGDAPEAHRAAARLLTEPEKIDRPFGVESIETVRGAGYRLRADGGRPDSD